MKNNYYNSYPDGEHCIVGLPLLLDDYCPWLAGLPLYVLRLSTEVNYEDEAECFRTMIEETAR